MPYFQPPLTLPPSLIFTSKTILITGTTSGLGLSATHLLLQQYSAAEIIFGVRDTIKGTSLASQLLSSPAIKKSNPNAKITVLKLDLESYESVMGFAREVKEKYGGEGRGGLDMVLMNAGTGSLRRVVLEDRDGGGKGHEKIIQVNLLSPALLAVELMPLLEATARKTGQPGRISWVGSFVQFDHSFDKIPIPSDVLAKDNGISNGKDLLSYLDEERSFVAMKRYADSKLLVTMFVERLSQYVDPRLVVLNDVSPGMVRTGFGEYPMWLRGMMAVLFGLRARSPEEGAKTYLFASGVAGAESHGKYLSDNLIAERAPITKTPVGKEIQEKLWDDMWKEFVKLDPSLEMPKRQIL
ncbi:short-chain dehydrogenase/reductase family protein [Cadophora sp. MPI-SDFR-AT-0126]|nr:short-chain dehydrogenase/reductase family protein [Leotiomycetes sp. MPI-SDFR-AT-0126]